jgi:Protein of unknown function (DUF2721)
MPGRCNVMEITPRRTLGTEDGDGLIHHGSSNIPMNDISRLFQAFVAPAIFVSATALLVLSVNVRLMGMVSRLRQYIHARYDAEKHDRAQEAEAYTAQIESINQRAEMIRRCFLLTLVALAASILSCLLLGLGLYWTEAAIGAAILFVAAMICMLLGTVYYIREVMLALSSVREEASDSRFMDIEGRRIEDRL